MRPSTLLTTVALAVASVQAQDVQMLPPDQIISMLPSWISQLPQIFHTEAPKYLSSLDALVSQYKPTGAVSDIPKVFSSYAPQIESYAAAAITGLIPSGVLPPAYASALPSLISSAVPQVFSLVYSDLTQFVPASAQITDVPKILSTQLPAIEAALPTVVDQAIPMATNFMSSYAKAVGYSLPGATGATYPTGTGSYPSVTAAPTLSTSATGAAQPSQSIITGAGNSLSWSKGMAGLAAVGAIFAMF